MPLLGGLLVNLFGAVVAWFSQWVTRKVAFGLAAVSMSSGLTLSLFMTMRFLLSMVSQSMGGVPAIFLEAVAVVMPPVAVFCVSTHITAWAACPAYKGQRDLLHLAVKA